MNDAYQRVTTIRITEEQAVEVELVARVLGISASELIRTAISEYLTKRKGEVEFRQRLARRIEQDRRILDRLSVECNCCCDRVTARLVVCPAHPMREHRNTPEEAEPECNGRCDSRQSTDPDEPDFPDPECPRHGRQPVSAELAPSTDCPHCGRTAKDCDSIKARGWGNCCIRCEQWGRVETHRLRAVTYRTTPVMRQLEDPSDE